MPPKEKKAAGSKKPARKEQIIRVVVEVVIRIETPSISPAVVATRLLQAAEPDNFDYSFDLTGITVLKMIVERFQQERPAVSGSFFSEIPDPNPVKHIHVTIIAHEDNPPGSGTMTLKFNGKDVFATPQPFEISGGIAGINQNPSLP